MQSSIAAFLADLRLAGRGARTIEGHELELKRLARWCDAEQLDWRQLDRRQLQAYCRLRAALGFSSRSNMLCSLRVFFRWAVEQGEIAMSPAAGFKTPTKPRPVPRALTRHQVRQLVCHLAAGDGRRARRDEALLITALYAGLRAAELAALCWPAVDLGAQLITIRLSKMNHGRSVPLHPVLQQQLPAWRELQAGGDSWPVFSLDGRPINANRAGKVARRAARATGLPLTTHVLRHTFATWALRGSRDLFGVSRALGHAALKQTEIYLAAAVDDLRPAVDSLPNLDRW